MTNPYPADVADSGGNVRLSGAITFTDAENQPGGGGIPTGNDSPVGVVTPAAIGELYADTTHGGLYIAHGLTDADWTSVGGVAGSNGVGEVIGIVGKQSKLYLLAGTDPDTPLNGPGAVLSDAYAQWNGIGSGLSIVGDGTEGHQSLVWTNSAGAFTLVDQHGTLGAPPGGIAFPSSDPHIADAWWNNSGTLVRSSG